MSRTRFLGQIDELRRTFTTLCAWAESIVLCTTRIESGSWAWDAVAQHQRKLTRVLVAERGGDEGATELLHRTSALRWVSETSANFAAHLYLFRRGDEARALVGGPRLGVIPDGGIEVGTLLEGHVDDEWCCAIRDAFDEVGSRARVPVGDDLRRVFTAAVGGDAPLGGSETSCGELFPDARIGTLHLITDAAEVRLAREEFVTAFRSRTRAYARPFPVQGGIGDPHLHWHPQYGVWATFGLLGSRFGKAFGTQPPESGGVVTPAVEINVPLAGIDRRCAGAFAREPESGRRYLVHRGRIGRGLAAARAFWRATRMRGVPLDEGDGGEAPRVALVTDLGSPRLVEHVAAFVRELERIGAVVAETAADEDPVTLANPAAETFLDWELDTQVENIYEFLLGQGALEKDEAIRRCARAIRDEGLLEFQRLRAGGAIYDLLYRCLEEGVAQDLFDRPRRNHIRAVCRDADDFPRRLWEEALMVVVGDEPMERDEAIRRAFEWALETVGLGAQRLRTGGRVETGIKNGIRRAIQRGALKAVSKTTIQRA